MDNVKQTVFIQLYNSAYGISDYYSQEELDKVYNFIQTMNNEPEEVESNESFTKEELEEMKAAGINIISLIGSKSHPDTKQLELTVKAARKLPIGMFIRVVKPKSYSALMARLKEQLGETNFKITTSFNKPNSNEEAVRVVTIKRVKN